MVHLRWLAQVERKMAQTLEGLGLKNLKCCTWSKALPIGSFRVWLTAWLTGSWVQSAVSMGMPFPVSHSVIIVHMRCSSYAWTFDKLQVKKDSYKWCQNIWPAQHLGLGLQNIPRPARNLCLSYLHLQEWASEQSSGHQLRGLCRFRWEEGSCPTSLIVLSALTLPTKS